MSTAMPLSGSDDPVGVAYCADTAPLLLCLRSDALVDLHPAYASSNPSREIHRTILCRSSLATIPNPGHSPVSTMACIASSNAASLYVAQ